MSCPSCKAHLDSAYRPIKRLQFRETVSDTVKVAKSQDLAVNVVVVLAAARDVEAVLLRVHPERVVELCVGVEVVETDVLGEVRQNLFLVGDVSKGAVVYEGDVLLDALHLGLDELLDIDGVEEQVGKYLVDRR